MWKRFLGPYALIIGIDIDPNCKTLEEEQIKIEIGSQSDEKFLRKILTAYGPVDVVIDDGSHMMTDILTSFKTLFSSIMPDGVYIVEDLHTAYWPEYGGGLQNPNSFIEFSKTIIDAMHGSYNRDQEQAPLEDLILQVAETTRSIMILDSIIAFEKGRKIRKHAPLIGHSHPKSNIISELSF
jgi:hypothetical protein